MKVRLGEVVDRITGNVDRLNTELEYYVGGEHYESGALIINQGGLLNSPEGKKLGFKFHFPFQKNDVLFMARNPHLRKAAKVMFDGICSDASYILRTKDNSILLQDFLAIIVQSDLFWLFFEANKSGSVNYLMNWKELQNYEFELPNIEKQKDIVKLIWSIETTKQKYLHLLNLTNELIKSRFIEMFGEPGTDPYKWGIKSLGDCCEINPRKPHNIDMNKSYSFVGMSSVTVDGHIDVSTDRPYSEICKGFTYFAENDVLFAKITPCMENGKGCVAKGLHNGIGFGSTEFHVLRPIKGVSNPYWLYTITMFKKFRFDAEKVMTGTGGQRRVPVSYLSDYQIALAPIALQEKFASLVCQTDKSKLALQRSLVQLVKLQKSLMKEYLG